MSVDFAGCEASTAGLLFHALSYHPSVPPSLLSSRLDSVWRISGDKERSRSRLLLKTGTGGKTVVLSAGKDTNASLKTIVSHRLLLSLCHAE